MLDVDDDQVAAAHEGDEPAVGAERHLVLGLRGGGEAAGALRADVVVVEVVGEIEDQRRAVPVRHVPRLAGDAGGIGRAQARQRRHRRFERRDVVQRRALAGERVHPGQGAGEGVARRAPCDVVPVVQPTQAERGVAVEVDPPRRIEDVGDGQRALLGIDRGREDGETGGRGHDEAAPPRTCAVCARTRAVVGAGLGPEDDAVEGSCKTHGTASRPV